MSEKSISVIQAASLFRDSLVPKADRQEPFPMWYGWALADSFIAGADWHLSQYNDECGVGVGPYNLRVLQASGASNILGAHNLITGLAEKAAAIVELLDEEEKHHGGLVRVETLKAKNELRLELARWK